MAVSTMEFRLLGQVEAFVDGNRIELGRPQERRLLAVLLLDAGRIVPVDRLIEMLWDDEPPRHARHALHTSVSRLRRRLAEAGAGRFGCDMVNQRSGYLLSCDRNRVDLHRFRSLVARARDTAAPAERARLLRVALSLWRGPALADVASVPLAERVCAGLDELRLSALEARIDADLELGRHDELVHELFQLTREQPLRERLVAQQMLALCRVRRQSEALRGFAAFRKRLAEETGLDPGRDLCELQQAILRDDPRLLLAGMPAPGRGPDPAVATARAGALSPAGSAGSAGSAGPGRLADGPVAAAPTGSPPPLPAQLAADVADFTGRCGYLAQLDEALGPGQPGDGTALALAVVCGAAGMGKTALALHWAHQTAARFPDGQLFVNLHGHAHNPTLTPAQALAHLLAAVGVAAHDVPADVGAAAAMYRSLLAGRRMLVLLDDAATAAQVRPLLPGGPRCAVLVTSRNRLDGLVAHDGAREIPLDVLAADEAHTLLSRMLGADRVTAAPRAAADLATLCGCVPLALRIAGANLAASPHRPLAGQVAELAQGDLLAALRVAGDESAGVASAFDLSYSRLDPAAQLLFRRLSLVPGPDFTAEAAAALTQAATGAAARGLRVLSAAHLVAERAPDRFALHDLLRCYARARLERHETQAEREAAGRRLLDWYLSSAYQAALLLYAHLLPSPPPTPGCVAPITFAGYRAAVGWLDTERPSLVAACRHAAEYGPAPGAWQLAEAMRGYFSWRGHAADWLATAEAGLKAATVGSDTRAQVRAHRNLAHVHHTLGHPDAVLEHLTRALGLAHRAHWRQGELEVLGNLGILSSSAGRLEQAATYRAHVLAGCSATALDQQVIALTRLAVVDYLRGKLAVAAEHGNRAVRLCRGGVPPDLKAVSLATSARVHADSGRLRAALAQYTEALKLFQLVGDRSGEAGTLCGLAGAYRDIGQHGLAAARAGRALGIATRGRDRGAGAEALNALGAVLLRRGDSRRALACHEQALCTTSPAGVCWQHVEAVLGRALSRCVLGQLEQAVRDAEQALGLARGAGYRRLEGQALLATGRLRLAQQDVLGAVAAARQARVLLDDVGFRLGTAQALVLTGDALWLAASGHRGCPLAGLPARHELVQALRGLDVPARVPAEAPTGRGTAADWCAVVAAEHWRRALAVLTRIGAVSEANRVRAMLGQGPPAAPAPSPTATPAAVSGQ